MIRLLFQARSAVLVLAAVFGLALSAPAQTPAAATPPPPPPALPKPTLPPFTPPPPPPVGLRPPTVPPDGLHPPGLPPLMPPLEQLPPVELGSADAALKRLREAIGHLEAGKIWIRNGPRGERIAQASILFEGKEVGRLMFDPVSGAVLPRGYRPPPAPTPSAATPAPSASPATAGAPAATPATPSPAAAPEPNLDAVKAKLAEVLKALKPVDGLEIGGRGSVWRLPLVYEGRIVSDLHASGDGTRILQDFATTREVAAFAH